MSKAFVPLIVSGISVGIAANAVMGQAIPAVQPAPTPASNSLEHQSAKELSTQYLMQNNGGSLLAAQAAQQVEPVSSAEPGKQVNSTNLYAVTPPEAHVLKKHDLINIVVNEQSSSQTNGKSDQERAVDFDAKVDAFVKFNLAKLSLQGGAEGANPPEMKLEGTRDFKATGEYDRSDTMTTRLGAEIIDVKPNGTLVVQARRHLKIDEEELTMTLSGECRVADVDASNAVLSTDLHDMSLEKKTTGEVTDTNKRGILHRLLDMFGPF